MTYLRHPSSNIPIKKGSIGRKPRLVVLCPFYPHLTLIIASNLLLTGATIGGVLAACFAALLLLLVPCYLKRRHRRPESPRADDMEYGHSRQSGFASSNHKAVS
jgi:hypothetical protein